MSGTTLPLILTISLTHLRVVAKAELIDSVGASWTLLQSGRAIHELSQLQNAEDPTGEVVRGVLDMLEDLSLLLEDSATKALATTIFEMAREVTGEEPLF